MLALTLILNGNEYKVFFDNKQEGVNGDFTNKYILPKVLNNFNIEYTSFKTYKFRYYLGQAISKITVYNGNDKLDGHFITSKVIGSKVLSI